MRQARSVHAPPAHALAIGATSTIGNANLAAGPLPGRATQPIETSSITAGVVTADGLTVWTASRPAGRGAGRATTPAAAWNLFARALRRLWRGRCPALRFRRFRFTQDRDDRDCSSEPHEAFDRAPPAYPAGKPFRKCIEPPIVHEPSFRAALRYRGSHLAFWQREHSAVRPPAPLPQPACYQTDPLRPAATGAISAALADGIPRSRPPQCLLPLPHGS
jgi:hypothetical protein